MLFADWTDHVIVSRLFAGEIVNNEGGNTNVWNELNLVQLLYPLASPTLTRQ